MSYKIPQSEWGAVAARRQQGEAVAAIAHSYGCSPALVYTILRRHNADPAETAATGPNPVAESNRLDRDEDGSLASGLADVDADDEIAAAEKAAPLPPALTAQLDADLRVSIEAALTTFSSTLDAALSAARHDAAAREALRNAASDLMRAGARTIIVLERLAARADVPQVATLSPGGRPDARRGTAPQEAEREPAPVPGSSAPVEGTVKWYNPKKGMGFVTVSKGKDVFVRAHALKRSGLSNLQQGQKVRLSTRVAPKGPEADRIELI